MSAHCAGGVLLKAREEPLVKMVGGHIHEGRKKTAIKSGGGPASLHAFYHRDVLGTNAERADLIVISQPGEFVLSSLPKYIDRCRIGLRGAIGGQDMAGRCDSAC